MESELCLMLAYQTATKMDIPSQSKPSERASEKRAEIKPMQKKIANGRLGDSKSDDNSKKKEAPNSM